MDCSRCTTPIPAVSLAHPERCWYCAAPLCEDCWEQYGCCGEPEAERVNEAFREVFRAHTQKENEE